LAREDDKAGVGRIATQHPTVSNQGGLLTTLYRRLPQKLRRFFRRHRIDVEPCAPFETGDLREFGNDFDVPVVEIPGLLVERRAMEDEVVRWTSKDLVH